jgi:hypothetical protein
VVASRRFGRLVDADRRRLLDQPRPPHPPVATEEMLAGLPEPAQRYLRYAGVVGRPMVDTVRLRQECRMRPAPGGISLPLVAEQWYTVEPPGFIWDATVPIAGIPLVRGRDGYLEGRGMMTIRGGSVIPFVDAAGPEMNQASLLRHLSEIPWFPSAFLRDRISWEAIDDTHVRVSITDGDLRATGVLEIDAEGRLVAFRSERHAMVGKGFELRPWTAPTYAYGEFRAPPSDQRRRGLDAPRRDGPAVHRGAAHRGRVRPAPAGVERRTAGPLGRAQSVPAAFLMAPMRTAQPSSLSDWCVEPGMTADVTGMLCCSSD